MKNVNSELAIVNVFYVPNFCMAMKHLLRRPLQLQQFC